MSQAEAVGAGSGRLATWCGWVLMGGAVLAPVLIWLGPLAFAPLVALMGLLSLPAVRIGDEDRPALIVLFALLIWAAASTTWSPFHPKSAGSNTILKLAAELPIYYAAVCGARRARPALARRALLILAWGCTAVGLVLLAEALTGGAVYQWLHQTFYQPIRPDLAGKNLAFSGFALAVIWPLAALGGPGKAQRWMALAMAAGVAGSGLAFGADAPLLSLAAAPVAALAVLRWPKGGAFGLALVAAGLFLLAPLVVWALRAGVDYPGLVQAAPVSWGMRLGYWSHAVDWIAERPLRGWGLDASRMFSPGIHLHPHDAALQVWLELGLPGAVAAAAFWGVALMRLARPASDRIMAAAAAASAAYLLFGAVNFGIWQEWWLALGALIPAFAAALRSTRAGTPG